MERHYIGGRKYRKLIALTQQVKDDLMNFYSVPDQDVVILPNGFDPNEFGVHRRADERAETRRRLGYAEHDRVVVFVANELERKGFGPLLRAISRLQDPSIRLLVAGRTLIRSYAAEIESLGMTARVKYVGSASDVATCYAAGDVFALPTEYEAWGLVIIEALACGLPVLTSRLAGAAIAVSESRTGALLDDPRDVDEVAAKLASLLRGSHEPPETISCSVANYSWDKILERYEQVLLEHVANLSSGPSPERGATRWSEGRM